MCLDEPDWTMKVNSKLKMPFEDKTCGEPEAYFDIPGEEQDEWCDYLSAQVSEGKCPKEANLLLRRWETYRAAMCGHSWFSNW